MQITSDDLYDYGMWARDAKDQLGAKSAWTAVMKNNVSPSSPVHSYTMTDDKASVIDRAVCQLRHVDSHLGLLFKQHYIEGLGHRDLAKIHNCGKGRVASDLHKASGFVIGVAILLSDGIELYGNNTYN